MVELTMHELMTEDEADDEPLPFGQSYWDYLPDLVQTKIMKMVHKQILEERAC